MLPIDKQSASTSQTRLVRGLSQNRGGLQLIPRDYTTLTDSLHSAKLPKAAVAAAQSATPGRGGLERTPEREHQQGDHRPDCCGRGRA